jgi:ABC-type phosphate transport system permease subunit
MRHQGAILFFQAHIGFDGSRTLVVGLAVALLVRPTVARLDRFVVERATRTLHDDLASLGAHMEFGTMFRVLLDDAQSALLTNL